MLLEVLSKMVAAIINSYPDGRRDEDEGLGGPLHLLQTATLLTVKPARDCWVSVHFEFKFVIENIALPDPRSTRRFSLLKMREARIIRPAFSRTSVTYRLIEIPRENGEKVWTFMKPSYFRRFVSDVRYHHVWLHASTPGQVNKVLVNAITGTKRIAPRNEPPFRSVRVLTASGPIQIYFNDHNAIRAAKPSRMPYISREASEWE